ncbi:hypothetical protein MK489_05720 [Myxococcota bacterium]|nr:hypothetical protein [Myxococcota bacterium]
MPRRTDYDANWFLDIGIFRPRRPQDHLGGLRPDSDQGIDRLIGRKLRPNAMDQAGCQRKERNETVGSVDSSCIRFVNNLNSDGAPPFSIDDVQVVGELL